MPGTREYPADESPCLYGGRKGGRRAARLQGKRRGSHAGRLPAAGSQALGPKAGSLAPPGVPVAVILWAKTGSAVRTGPTRKMRREQVDVPSRGGRFAPSLMGTSAAHSSSPRGRHAWKPEVVKGERIMEATLLEGCGP